MNYNQYVTQKYIPQLDGIRAIAVLGVICAHMHTTAFFFLSGGRGLTWFFVLSGYLITRLCIQEENTTGRVNMGAFYVRRAFRILPLYFATLAAYCVLILGLGIGADKRDGLLAALPYYLTFLSELPVMLNVHGDSEVPFGHSWSLGIEEKFYLIWPALGFLLLVGKGKERMYTVIGLYILVSACMFLDSGPQALLFSSYANILAGCVLGVILHTEGGFKALTRMGTARWLVPWGIALVVLHFAVPEPHQESGGVGISIFRILYTIMIVGMMAGILLGQGPLQNFLRLPLLESIGKVSYGIYLLHRLCLNVVEPMVGSWAGWFEPIIEFILIAILSYYVARLAYIVIEGPAIRLGRRISANMQKPDPQPVTPAPLRPKAESINN